MKKSFNEKVYDKVRRIPKGKVSTYRAVAKSIGTKAYRAVGNAMNKNPYAYCVQEWEKGNSAKQHLKLVPCHRVINANGNLGGFSSGLKNKIRILKAEGIEIKNNKIDLTKYEFKFIQNP